MKILTFAFVFASSLVISAAQQPAAPQAATAPRTPMMPSDPHEPLAFFIGTWTTAEAPPEQKFVETCDWLPLGRRHVVCRARYETPTGPREGMSIFSYRPLDQMYLHHGFSASGVASSLTGKLLPDGVWEFGSEQGTGEQRTRTRVRIWQKDAQGGFRFTQQTAKGDGSWSEEQVVNYRRVR